MNLRPLDEIRCPATATESRRLLRNSLVLSGTPVFFQSQDTRQVRIRRRSIWTQNGPCSNLDTSRFVERPARPRQGSGRPPCGRGVGLSHLGQIAHVRPTSAATRRPAGATYKATATRGSHAKTGSLIAASRRGHHVGTTNRLNSMAANSPGLRHLRRIHFLLDRSS